MEPDLTLDKAKRLICQRDAVKEQQEILKVTTKEESTLDAVNKKPPRRILSAIPSTPQSYMVPLRSCRRCGKGSHPRQTWPARDVTCFRCNRRGHYSTFKADRILYFWVAFLSRELKDYWKYRGELTLYGGLLLYNCRIVIPTNMRLLTLEKIHSGHQGIQQCRMRVSTPVWWPGVSKAMENFVQSCPICQKTLNLSREPLINTPLPSYPWERIAADLFDLKGSTYLLVVDYFSRFVEVQKLNTTTSPSVVTHLKSIFARFGIPATMITDNGPQFK